MYCLERGPGTLLLIALSVLKKNFVAKPDMSGGVERFDEA